MQRILLTAFIFFILLLTHVNNSYAMAQISMQNNTSLWLNLYIDGNFGCGPVMPSGFCTSSVNAGPHLLEARKGQEVVATEKDVNIGDGTSPTWTVNLEDPNQALIKKLDGTRYISRRDWPQIKAEYDLIIKGTSLIWKMRFVWAAPGIEMPRPIGTWAEIDQVKIVGREAHSYHQAKSPQQRHIVFIISEDGNTITEESEGGKFIYYRQ